MNLLAVVPLLSFFLAIVYGHDNPKPITALLNTKWPRTPLLLEASEFIATQDGAAFWQFVEATKDIYSSVNSEKELYDVMLEYAEGVLPPLTYNLFIFILALHTHSPTIEMYNQVALERLRVLGEVDCEAFVDLSGGVACSVEQLHSLLHSGEESPLIELFDFDHRYPSSPLPSSPPPTAILYAQLGTTSFFLLHSALSELASEGRLQYVLRHFVKSLPSERTQLAGYGVRLAVKSTEYKAVDDSQVKEGEEGSRVMGEAIGSDEIEGFFFNTLKSRHPELSPKLEEFQAHLLQSTRELPELKAWQLQDLGFQAAQRAVSSSPDLALKVMKDIAQNLPVQAKSLSRTQVSKELRQEIVRNQKSLSMYGIDPGDSVLLLNGIILQEDSTDIFHLVDVLLSESRLLSGLQSLGIANSDLQQLMRVPVHMVHRNFAVDMRNESVVFINDLESEILYSSWPKSLQEFMKPMYPGMLKQIQKNVFTIVFCLDPATPEGVEMVEYIKLFLNHMVPVRMGLLLVAEGEEGSVGPALVRGFSYLVENKSPREAMRWLYQAQSLPNQTSEEVITFFGNKYKKGLKMPLEEIFGEQSPHDSLRRKSLEFFRKKGFDFLSQVLVNGVQLDLEEDLESAVVTKIQQQTFEIQQAVFLKKLKDSMNVYDYFLNKSNVLQRLNRHVVAANSKQLDLSEQAPSLENASFSELSARQMASTLARDLHYFANKEGEFTTKQLSVWVVGDVGSVQGREVLRNGLQFAANQLEIRLAVVHNPLSLLLPSAVEAALQSQPNKKAWEFVSLLLTGEPAASEDVLGVAEGVHGLDVAVLREQMEGVAVGGALSRHVTFCREVLGLERGATAIVSNGRLIGPLSSNETFEEADFQMLFQFESSTHASAVLEAVGGVVVGGVSPDEDTAEFRSGLVMEVASLMRSEPHRRRMELPQLKEEHSVIHLPSSAPELELQLMAYLDPLSPSTQQLAPLIQTLRTVTSIDTHIFLNPQAKLSEMPIKSFYRFVLEPELSFEENGRLSAGPLAVFSSLPPSPLLTLGMEVPHSWLVEAVFAPHDLDNIHLAEVEQGVRGEFQLEHILVEGQCFDALTDRPIPGLEYVLGTDSQPERFDTIVMANLGYFQLKASPGAWTLRLREGRSAEIYSIASHYGGESSNGDGIRISVTSFKGAGVVVRVGKRSGMEGVSLLYDEEKDQGQQQEEEVGPEDKEEGDNLWESITNRVVSLIGGGSEQKKPEKQRSKVSTENETINIYSIASGHLYERFLRIMMLSVLKHTNNPVKFWFLKNYLSPIFKDSIPEMAREYGFEYELVQYKWPRWLHGQTEKQRLIWGYKILFLDVLFPLSVKKIIFVDADQIVRTDLKELLEIPLYGAPYGYTPFCNDRPEMAGFRFWERGYWKNHLGNRRYHISALYVVDLKRFRQLAAGDRLRGQYQALSQDPNSLANLDQDLPNNMIHAVPIRSLPQEWLWCETWCSNESKERAKTIDLCNNPQTKEPKLASAMRIVPEWEGYDREIKQLLERMASRSKEGGQNADTHGHEEL